MKIQFVLGGYLKESLGLPFSRQTKEPQLHRDLPAKEQFPGEPCSVEAPQGPPSHFITRGPTSPDQDGVDGGGKGDLMAHHGPCARHHTWLPCVGSSRGGRH